MYCIISIKCIQKPEKKSYNLNDLQKNLYQLIHIVRNKKNKSTLIFNS